MGKKEIGVLPTEWAVSVLVGGADRGRRVERHSLGVGFDFVVEVVVDFIVVKSPCEVLDDGWGLDGNHGAGVLEGLRSEGVAAVVQHSLGVFV